eukprot:TRINITY_DN21635_c0_g1_i1.p1 TRINITY_DN21635_c0_g1~~TRINITY_DN21635_c0_g1_i1.p1  ORF type:complete len:384 (+),score=134.55 TRINITY_DN21635_c0_g1_i1:74-1225(+)
MVQTAEVDVTVRRGESLGITLLRKGVDELRCTAVAPGGPGHKAGFPCGGVLLSVQGRAVHTVFGAGQAVRTALSPDGPSRLRLRYEVPSDPRRGCCCSPPAGGAERKHARTAVARHVPPGPARRWYALPRAAPVGGCDSTLLVRLFPDGMEVELDGDAVVPISAAGTVPGSRVRIRRWLHNGVELSGFYAVVLPSGGGRTAGVVPAVGADRMDSEPGETDDAWDADQPRQYPDAAEPRPDAVWLRLLPHGESVTVPPQLLHPIGGEPGVLRVGDRAVLHGLAGDEEEYNGRIGVVSPPQDPRDCSEESQRDSEWLFVRVLPDGGLAAAAPGHLIPQHGDSLLPGSRAAFQRMRGKWAELDGAVCTVVQPPDDASERLAATQVL